MLYHANSELTENEGTSELKLVNLVTNKIIPVSAQRDILKFNAERCIYHTCKQNVKAKVFDLEGWMQYSELNAESEVVSLKATNSLFVCLLLITKSSREVNLEDIAGKHEFASSNGTLTCMKSDGSLLPNLS